MKKTITSIFLAFVFIMNCSHTKDKKQELSKTVVESGVRSLAILKLVGPGDSRDIVRTYFSNEILKNGYFTLRDDSQVRNAISKLPYAISDEFKHEEALEANKTIQADAFCYLVVDKWDFEDSKEQDEEKYYDSQVAEEYGEEERGWISRMVPAVVRDVNVELRVIIVRVADGKVIIDEYFNESLEDRARGENQISALPSRYSVLKEMVEKISREIIKLITP